MSLLGTKAWLSQQGGSYSAISMDVMKNYNILLKRLPAPYHVYDPVSSGPGVLTYILSSLEAENSNFIRLKTQADWFCNCTMSTTMKRLGDFWKFSTAMTPSTCHAPCSNDLNTLSTPITLPDYALHLDYTLSGFGSNCHQQQKLQSLHADEVTSRRILHNRSTSDILVSIDVVTAGGYHMRGQTLTTTSQRIDRFHCAVNPKFGRFSSEKLLTATCESEVFVMSDYSAQNYYHFTIDQMSRVSAFVPFLQSNPQIKLHVGREGKNT